MTIERQNPIQIIKSSLLVGVILFIMSKFFEIITWLGTGAGADFLGQLIGWEGSSVVLFGGIYYISVFLRKCFYKLPDDGK